MDYISQGEENEAVLKWSGGGGDGSRERALLSHLSPGHEIR